ncbi:hypothetical protein C0991_004170 [Blastosporella zonata]|nr:hypothetical protein C0991_004170 [Blastosporella zonata]
MANHKTLENFATQRDLSQRQAWWMEFLSQFDCKIVYLKGKDNSVADALSQLPTLTTDTDTIAIEEARLVDIDKLTSVAVILDVGSTSSTALETATQLAATSSDVGVTSPERQGKATKIAIKDGLLHDIGAGYKTDPWFTLLASAATGMKNVEQVHGLWFIDK